MMNYDLIAIDPHAHNYLPRRIHPLALGPVKQQRNAQIVRDVLNGDTYRKAATKNHVSADRVRQIVLRFASRTLTSLDWLTDARNQLDRHRGWLLRALAVHERLESVADDDP